MVLTRSSCPWQFASVTCTQVVQADAWLGTESTLVRYLPMLGSGVTAVSNTMQRLPYLAGIGPSTVMTRLKLQFWCGTAAAVAHRKELVTRHSSRQEAAVKQCLLRI